MNKKILSIGDINIDLALKKENIFNFSKSIGTEIEIDDYSFEIGGSSFNFIKALGSFGVEVAFNGRIGNDVFGNYIRKYLEDEKIDHILKKDEHARTGITTIIPFNNDRLFLTFNGSNEYFNVKDIEFENIKNFNHVHLSSYYLLKGLQSDILDIFKYLKSHNITISFDTGFDPDRNWQRDKIFSILKYVDVFIPNELEVIKITKRKNITDAINHLIKYCPIVIVKLGSKGSAGKNISSKCDDIVYMPSFNSRVIDTSCSGDCFNAGFIYKYLSGFDLKECLRFANACGALQVNRLGSYKFRGEREIYKFIEDNE